MNEEKGGPLLAIFAHPDDELFVSPVLANYARRGIECHLVIATDGRFGVQDHAGGIKGDELARMRTGELRKAADILGVSVVQLGFEDGFAHKTADLKQVLALFSELFRQVQGLMNKWQPEAILTFGGDGIYGHPDHIMVGNAVTAAFQCADLQGTAQLFYPGVVKELIPERLLETVTRQAGTIPVFPVADHHLPIRVNVEEEDLVTARLAMGCHASQFTAQQIERVGGLFHGAKTHYFRPWSGTGRQTRLLEQVP